MFLQRQWLVSERECQRNQSKTLFNKFEFFCSASSGYLGGFHERIDIITIMVLVVIVIIVIVVVIIFIIRAECN